MMTDSPTFSSAWSGWLRAGTETGGAHQAFFVDCIDVDIYELDAEGETFAHRYSINLWKRY